MLTRLQVLSQWWKGLSCMWWTDTLAMELTVYLPGQGRAKEVRRYILRMANLSSALALTRISTAVAKRFPTHDHLVQVSPTILAPIHQALRPPPPIHQAGLMTEKEKARVVALEGVCRHQVGLLPCLPLLHPSSPSSGGV